jgi:hypothetical protein
MNGGIADKEDLRIYRLLQLADSIHDFDPLPTDKEFLYRIHRKELAFTMGMDKDDSLPVGFSLDDMQDPGKFLEKCDAENLTFGNIR